MKHDLLFSLLNPKNILNEAFTSAENVLTFLHPGERKILEDIIQIARQYQDIVKFSKTYRICLKGSSSLDAIEDPLQKGLYLQAFTDGIDKVIENYIEEIVDLEKSYLQNPTHSLLFIYHRVQTYQTLFTFLQKLIDGIKVQKLHGCAIIQYLHQNMLHGNKEISDYMKIIFTSVNKIFLKQLTHWILYGKIIDTYGEFFIQNYECRNTTTNSERCNSVNSSCKNTASATVSTTVRKILRATKTVHSKQHHVNFLPDGTSTYAEVWRYDICCDFLPYYLPYSWAEKVLFIGQTVLMFKMDSNKKNTVWNENDKNLTSSISSTSSPLSYTTAPTSTLSPSSSTSYGGYSLWDNQEHKFLKMIQNLHDNEEIVIVSQYEKIIDDIKSYVTERLSQIAVKQADLVKQLKLIKDFYLLGRGELYLEFIKRALSVEKLQVNENTIRDLIRAFDFAANSLNIMDDLESFSLALCKNKTHNIFDIENFSYFQYVCLEYKIEWPLHLLFSPKVIEKYNELFRFLLLIKKIQYDLHMIWASNRKNNGEIYRDRIKLMHLLHQLMFLIDNLQYYIQVDVLESQFSILMNTVLNSTDFENIQRAHSIFLANVLSLCFLLSNNDQMMNTQISVIQCSDNPVLSSLNKIFHLCESFCTLAKTCNSPLTKDEIKKTDTLEAQLSELIKELMDLLCSLKGAPNSTPLSQLLLRLDFNYWFSRNED